MPYYRIINPRELIIYLFIIYLLFKKRERKRERKKGRKEEKKGKIIT